MKQDEAVRLWWQGVALWYNEQDYRQSMRVWREAIETYEWKDSQDLVPIERNETGEVSCLAPLLLFLAGCHLDAEEPLIARLLCQRCLSCCDRRLSHRAISEYIASVEEDPGDKEPWKQARQTAEWAMKNGLCDWANPYQRPGYPYPIPRQQPVYAREEQPSWCRLLENNHTQIRDEFQRLYKDGYAHWPVVGAGIHRGGAGQHDASVVQSGDWREVVLFGAGARPDLAPYTASLLQKSVPDAVDLANQGGGEVIFSVLAPHTHISPHCGSTNLRLTAHLGLVVPSDCRIRVADQWLTWNEGKVIVFDDSFEHEVVNDSSHVRAVLLLRFWHPGLPETERGTALELAFQAKQEDQLRRCNPPLPVGTNVERGMEKSRCTQCQRTGYETVRLISPELGFVCSCGQPIAS